MTEPAVVAGVILLTLLGSGLGAPDTCKTPFDAAARIRGELFFFKDDYFWRLTVHDRLMTRQPVEIDTFWHGLPERAAIDAAYQRPDGHVVFFCGRYFWVFWERHALPGYPRPLSDLGLPEELWAVDAAFVSGHNQGTYFITGNQYWRFNELTQRVENDSPQAVSRLCRGLPGRLNAAFADEQGATYFIQGQHYWRCDWPRAQVRAYAPDLVAPRWLGCSLVQCCLPDADDDIETELWPAQRTGPLLGRDAALRPAPAAAALTAALLLLRAAS